MNSDDHRNEQLIREVMRTAAAKDKTARRIMTIPNLAKLSNEDVDDICKILLKEFTASGLDKNSEPNKRGLEIEAAIDWVRKK